MSGHSHYNTIKRQKEANDAARGTIFSKLAKEIVIAVKSGGGPDPNSNYKLRVVVDKARAANMPKENVERAISRAETSAESLEEVTYEGFGPAGIGILVFTATDNRNRTAQEIKNIFDRAGCRLSGPGSVSFNFEPRGVLVVAKGGNPDEQMLKLIDLGIEDIEDQGDAFELYSAPDKLSDSKKKVEEAGFTVSSAELGQKAKSFQTVTDPNQAKKAISFLDTLDDHDDVQKVYSNLDIPAEIAA